METETRSAPPAGAGPNPEKEHRFGFGGEMALLVLTALVLALLIKTFLFQAFYIPTGSMEPTLHGPGDRVLVNKLPYYVHDPRRGDVIVFENPAVQVDRSLVGGFVHWLSEGLGRSGLEDEFLIKRVVGLPGETVEGRDGSVYIDGKRLDEPYLDEKTTDFGPEQVPEGELFMMGDNRNQSQDSRFIGTIPIGDVIGKAEVVIWPPSSWSVL
jgi:signal peptidase I